MYDSTDPRPPLSKWILECYGFLCTREIDVDNHEDVHSLPRERAVDALLKADELALEPTDVEYALTRLLERGYFYEVDDELRVTSSTE